MFSGEGDNSDIEKTTEDIIDETTFLQSVQHSETPRSLLSSTNRASVDEQNSIIQSRTPKTFADLLPEKCGPKGPIGPIGPTTTIGPGHNSLKNAKINKRNHRKLSLTHDFVLSDQKVHQTQST